MNSLMIATEYDTNYKDMHFYFSSEGYNLRIKMASLQSRS